jgi:hypothetical protein
MLDKADQRRDLGIGFAAGAGTLLLAGVLKLAIHHDSGRGVTDVAAGPGWIGIKGSF